MILIFLDACRQVLKIKILSPDKVAFQPITDWTDLKQAQLFAKLKYDDVVLCGKMTNSMISSASRNSVVWHLYNFSISEKIEDSLMMTSQVWF